MVPRRASALTLFAVVGVSFLARTCCAWRTYQSLIPNGDSVMRNGNAWPGVAHASERGGGVFNEFGTAFHAADKQWSVALCRADSDGDGFTNGEELGDPECVWTGGPASRQTDISHPGFADSQPEGTVRARTTVAVAATTVAPTTTTTTTTEPPLTATTAAPTTATPTTAIDTTNTLGPSANSIAVRSSIPFFAVFAIMSVAVFLL